MQNTDMYWFLPRAIPLTYYSVLLTSFPSASSFSKAPCPSETVWLGALDFDKELAVARKHRRISLKSSRRVIFEVFIFQKKSSFPPSQVFDTSEQQGVFFNYLNSFFFAPTRMLQLLKFSQLCPNFINLLKFAL